MKHKKEDLYKIINVLYDHVKIIYPYKRIFSNAHYQFSDRQMLVASKLGEPVEIEDEDIRVFIVGDIFKSKTKKLHKLMKIRGGFYHLTCMDEFIVGTTGKKSNSKTKFTYDQLNRMERVDG